MEHMLLAVQVAAEYDVRARNGAWTHQSFLRNRMLVLKKLALKLSEDAAKSASLLAALVWEADNHLKVHQKQVQASDLSGRLDQLEDRIAGEGPAASPSMRPLCVLPFFLQPWQPSGHEAFPQ